MPSVEQRQDVRQPDLGHSKDQIRVGLLNRRDQIPVDLRRQWSQKICHSIDKLIEERRLSRILFYLSMRSEVETDWLVAKQLTANRLVATPKVERETIRPYRLTNLQAGINLHKLGMREPDTAICDPVDPESLDLVLVPGCGFDLQRYRIGYGGGFYDRFLLTCPQALTVGLTFEAQVVNQLPTQPWDQPVDLVLTEQRRI